MITKSYFDLSRKEKESTMEIEDSVDRLNWSVSSKVFLFSLFVIGATVYWNSPIECWSPVSTSGKGFDKFARDFAYIYPKSKTLPKVVKDRNDNTTHNSEDGFTLGYYIWTPFYLSLAAILLYIPHTILSYVSTNLVDMDLQICLTEARSAARKTGTVTQEKVAEISDRIVRMLDPHRMDLDGGCWTSFKNFIHRCCPFLLPSQRNGTRLAWTYLVISLLYLSISVVIVVGMAKFVGHNSGKEYVSALHSLMKGEDDAKNVFAKVVYSVIKFQDQITVNHYPLECVLPINMAWEKLFVMLSLWMMLMVVINGVKLIYLITDNQTRREEFVQSLLQVRADGEVNDINNISEFTKSFLKHDGVMVLRSIQANSNLTTTSHIAWSLWILYKVERNESSRLSSANTSTSDL